MPSSSSRQRSTRISVSGRGTSARAIGLQRQAAKVPVTEHVRKRLSLAAPPHELARGRPFRLRQRPVVLRVQLDPRQTDGARQNPFCVETGVLDATRLEVVGGSGQDVCERHRSSARRCSSAVSASVKLVERPCEHLLERHVQLHPVIRDAALGEVVRADLLGAPSRADLGTARRGLLCRLTLALGFVDAGAENAHRLLTVLQLRALVLHRDDDARRHVRDPHRGVGRVDRLSPGPRRAIDVDLQVAVLDSDVDILGLRHHRDRRSRRVDAPLRLGLGHALDAVRAALELEHRVRAVALDRERRLLQAAGVARRRPRSPPT